MVVFALEKNKAARVIEDAEKMGKGRGEMLLLQTL